MRVITGKYRGHRLKAVPGTNTRPTTDKIKESMFNIIGPYFSETKVLDMYAGSGALGLEALSRGADHVFACENNQQARDVIAENFKAVHAEKDVTILGGDNEKAILALHARDADLKFDFVFLDPPYKGQKIIETINFLTDNNLLAPQAEIICELGKKDDLPEWIGALQIYKNVAYGSTRLVMYILRDGGAANDN